MRVPTRALQLGLAAALGGSLALNLALVLVGRAVRHDQAEAFGRSIAYGCGFVAGELTASAALGLPIVWPEGMCEGERVNALHHGFAVGADPDL